MKYFDLVRFRPQHNYFNVAEHPLCLRKGVIDEREQSECPSRNVNGNEILCTGPGCNLPTRFTTTNLNRFTVGNCSSEVAEGCPVELFYRVKVGEGLSPLNLDPPMRIWVKNKIQRESSISSAGSYPGLTIGERELFKNIQPIQLVDVDTDVKNIEFSIDVPAARESAILSILPEFLIITPNDEHSMIGDSCLGVGCLGRVTLTGTQSKINALLKELAIQFEPDDAELLGTALTSLEVRIQTISPFRTFGGASTSLEFFAEFGEPPRRTRNNNYTVFWAAGLAFVCLVLICLISCFAKFSCFGMKVVNSCTSKTRKVQRTRKQISAAREDSNEETHKRRCRCCGRCRDPAIKVIQTIVSILCFLCPCLKALGKTKERDEPSEATGSRRSRAPPMVGSESSRRHRGLDIEYGARSLRSQPSSRDELSSATSSRRSRAPPVVGLESSRRRKRLDIEYGARSLRSQCSAQATPRPPDTPPPNRRNRRGSQGSRRPHERRPEDRRYSNEGAGHVPSS